MATPVASLPQLVLVTPVLPVGTTVLSVDSSVLPFIINSDPSVTRIEIGIYNQVFADNDFTVLTQIVNNTAVTNNQFTTSISLLPTVEETNVNIIGRNYDPTFAWQPNTSYPFMQRYADPNGNVEVVVAAGVSGATQPLWSTLLPVQATNVSVTSGAVTITATTNYQVGQQVYLTGFQNAAFLNGKIVTVSQNNATNFTAALSAVDYVSTADSGTCQAVTPDNGLLWANIGAIGITPILKFALLFFQSDLSVVIAPPSGLSANKTQTDCTLQWVTPDYPGFIGVRVMLSTDPSGINPPFTQYGDLVAGITSSTP